MDLGARQLRVLRGRSTEVRECREHPQRLLHRGRDQRGVLAQQPALIGVLHQRSHSAGVRRLRGVVAGGHQQEEPHHDLVLLELLAVDLSVHEDARQIVGRVLSPLGDHPPAAREQLAYVLGQHLLDPAWVQVGIAHPQHGIHQPRPHDVVFRRDAHEAPDDPRHHRLRDFVYELARLAAIQLVQHVGDDLADRRLVRRDPLGRKAVLKEHLQPVVLGRIHPDEHGLHELEREHVSSGGHAAQLGGIGLPVPADGVHVLCASHRPETALAGVLADLVRPVHGTFRTQAREQLVWGTVEPQWPLADPDMAQSVCPGWPISPRSAIARCR